ncbi:TetR/AcrR family transcriptional regulator [Longispora fulva]|uniref:AcrR family transcriptional regulator n=1 Tax=Longispora fulva TaxID=619741 RepID=A0A8J7GHT9_9ACTN|nr:TetR/AcrR family transcriptional regulator [Longispora fulva]MBG6136882.1 AcrR family transcriptional regulator [Longispora fulva]
MADSDDLRDQFIDAAFRVAAEHGPAGLTVRRVAEAAGASTMGVYSGFGGRTGMLGALYARAFELLSAAMAAAARTGDALADVCALADAYRDFAVDSPSRYAFMFERSVVDFDPGPQLRARALDSTFGQLRAAVAAAVPPDRVERTAYLVWAAMHGMVGIELTHRDRTALPDWSIAEDWPGVYREGVRAVWHGLAAR